MSDIYEKFLNHKKTSGLSRNTIEVYHSAFALFKTFLAKRNLDYRSLSSKQAENFCNFLIDLNYKPSTVNAKLSVLKGLYQYLRKNKIIHASPFAVVPRVHQPKAKDSLSLEGLKAEYGKLFSLRETKAGTEGRQGSKALEVKESRKTCSQSKIEDLPISRRIQNSAIYNSDVLLQPIEILNLSTRAHNCLKRGGVKTIKDLIDNSEVKLMCIWGFGRESLANILDVLKRFKPATAISGFGATGFDIPLLQRVDNPILYSSESLTAPIKELDLAVRSYNCLKREGIIDTVGKLVKYSESDLMKISNFGVGSFGNVLSALHNFRSYKRLPKDVKESTDIEKLSIDTLSLTTRSYNCLRRKGIFTVGQLIWRSPSDLLQIRNFGKLSLEDVEACLAGLGFFLQGGRAETPVVSVIKQSTIAAEVKELLGVLRKEKTREVLILRFGLDSGKARTLGEVGQELGVTRERIRQIESCALSRLRNYLSRNQMDTIQILLGILEDMGGVGRENAILERLSIRKPEGNISRQAVFSFLVRVASDKLKLFNRDQRIWGLSFIPQMLFQETVKELARILEEEGRVLSREILMARFLSTKFYEKHRNIVNSSFACACLQADSTFSQDENGNYGLRGWPSLVPKTRGDFIYLTLKKFGKPAHFTEITPFVNKILPPEKYLSSHTVHAVLIDDERFVRIDPGTYGLKEWNLRKDETVANTIYNILLQQGKPMHFQNLVERVRQLKKCKLPSVYAYLNMDSRFKSFAKGIYGLSNWSPSPQEIQDAYEEAPGSVRRGLLRDVLTLSDGTKVIKYQLSRGMLRQGYIRIFKEICEFFPTKRNSGEIKILSILCIDDDFGLEGREVLYNPKYGYIPGFRPWFIRNKTKELSFIYIIIKDLGNFKYEFLTEDGYGYLIGEEAGSKKGHLSNKILVDEIKKRIGAKG